MSKADDTRLSRDFALMATSFNEMPAPKKNSRSFWIRNIRGLVAVAGFGVALLCGAHPLIAAMAGILVYGVLKGEVEGALMGCAVLMFLGQIFGELTSNPTAAQKAAAAAESAHQMAQISDALSSAASTVGTHLSGISIFTAGLAAGIWLCVALLRMARR